MPEGYMGGGEGMLKSIKIKGKEYMANRMTKVLMENGTVEITYCNSCMSNEKKITAKFNECEFVSDKDGG